jgi:hypothetical protein
MIAAAVRHLVVAVTILSLALGPGCYRGTTSLAEAEAKRDAAWLGTRLGHPDQGPAAAALLVTLASRGDGEARAVLVDRLATMVPSPARDRLEAETAARLPALAAELAGDERPRFREAAARLRAR